MLEVDNLFSMADFLEGGDGETMQRDVDIQVDRMHSNIFKQGFSTGFEAGREKGKQNQIRFYSYWWIRGGLLPDPIRNY